MYPKRMYCKFLLSASHNPNNPSEFPLSPRFLSHLPQHQRDGRTPPWLWASPHGENTPGAGGIGPGKGRTRRQIAIRQTFRRAFAGVAHGASLPATRCPCSPLPLRSALVRPALTHQRLPAPLCWASPRPPSPLPAPRDSAQAPKFLPVAVTTVTTAQQAGPGSELRSSR